MTCPLCNLDLSNEKVFYQDNNFVVLRTKDLKGHKERIMVVYRVHEHSPKYQIKERALDILDKVGRDIFSYAPKWVIMDNTFATIREHWHLVCTDLDTKSDDFDQMLLTRWIKVMDNVNDAGGDYL